MNYFPTSRAAMRRSLIRACIQAFRACAGLGPGAGAKSLYAGPLLLIGGLLLAGQAAAKESDRNQPIELNADRAEMNNATGVGVYTGNVVLTQGTMRITADRMTVHTTPEGQIARAVAEGKQATFRQLPEGQSEYVHARAPRMEYRLQPGTRVDLTGGATLTQGKNEFSGQTIHYDVDADIVTAQSGEQAQERVRITFHPRQKTDQSDGGE
jgi:lipopolysaccharide export system protein LptA